MSDWSSFPNDKKLTDSWRQFLTEDEEELEEGWGDTYGGIIGYGPPRDRPAGDEEESEEKQGLKKGKLVTSQGIRTFFIKTLRGVLSIAQATALANAIENDLGLVKERRQPKKMPQTVAYILKLPPTGQQPTIKALANWLRHTQWAFHPDDAKKLGLGGKPPTTTPPAEEPLDVTRALGDKPVQSFADAPTNRQQRLAAARGEKGSSRTALTPAAKAMADAKRKRARQASKKARRKNRENLEIGRENAELISESVINQWQKLAGINPRVL